MSLTITKEQAEKGISIFKVTGEVDHHTFEMLDEQIANSIDDGEAKIILDLTECSYFSSSGIGVLVGAKSQAESEDGIFVLFGLVEGVRTVFDTMGFTPLFNIADSKEEAIQRVKAG